MCARVFHDKLLRPAMIKRLRRVDDRLFQGECVGRAEKPDR